MLVVELNDKTHEHARQRARDAFVAAALEQAGIPVLFQKTQALYKHEALRAEIAAKLARQVNNRGRSQTPAALRILRGKMRKAGWVINGLVITFLLMDAVMKLLAVSAVLQAGQELGFPGATMARGLGALLLVCTILYVMPRTATLGGILVTGYLGGAIATHLRLGNPLFSHTLFGVYIGIAMWIGLYLRDARLRALFRD